MTMTAYQFLFRVPETMRRIDSWRREQPGRNSRKGSSIALGKWDTAKEAAYAYNVAAVFSNGPDADIHP